LHLERGIRRLDSGAKLGAASKSTGLFLFLFSLLLLTSSAFGNPQADEWETRLKKLWTTISWPDEIVETLGTFSRLAADEETARSWINEGSRTQLISALLPGLNSYNSRIQNAAGDALVETLRTESGLSKLDSFTVARLRQHASSIPSIAYLGIRFFENDKKKKLLVIFIYQGGIEFNRNTFKWPKDIAQAIKEELHSTRDIPEEIQQLYKRVLNETVDWNKGSIKLLALEGLAALAEITPQHGENYFRLERGVALLLRESHLTQSERKRALKLLDGKIVRDYEALAHLLYAHDNEKNKTLLPQIEKFCSSI